MGQSPKVLGPGAARQKGACMVNILCIGDVVGTVGCQFLREKLPGLKRLKGVDLVVCNGENSADGNGITQSSIRHLFDSGGQLLEGEPQDVRQRSFCR